jgi:hypothetical protein
MLQLRCGRQAEFRRNPGGHSRDKGFHFSSRTKERVERFAHLPQQGI